MRSLRADERDSIRVEQVMVAVHDTILETVTIVVRENEQGDTLRLEKTTERDRFRDRAQVKEKEERVVVKTDTVFIEKRDSVDVRNHSPTSGAGSSGGFVASLRWIFWIIVAIGVLIIVIKVSRIIRI
ncbi:hypothetical protein [Xylanibacter ruminicola]|uniref:hypothetical protein n=1 Tax=Xylanibacter ruminicola TaxID=839 RepID=UPI00049009EA|nr:hypothetical protein [Xylanibacter ruminicola]